MEYEPPETSFDKSTGSSQNIKPRGNNQFQNNEQESSPLLRPFPASKNFNNGFIKHQNRNNSMANKHFKPPIRNRLGNRNFQHRNNNAGDNIQNPQGQRMMYNNRKRRDNNDPNTGGPPQPKRKWVKKSYYQNSNQQSHVSAQNRLEKIRNPAGGSTENIVKTETLNDSQDIDATDITVEVVNHTAHRQDENGITRFKMILNPKAQAAIKLIQSKRKDKQVIFPFPVTPNCTEISINERFSLL